MAYLVLFGPPGVGKGTQAAKLAERYHIPHISTGDIIRDNIRRGTPLGRKAEAIINRGHLLSDDITIELMQRRVEEPDAKNGYILDGFPRTVYQAMSFDLENLVDFTILALDAPPEILTKRILKRGQLLGRADDTKEIIEERLRVYEKQTLPVKEYYREVNRHRLVPIDATGTIEEVFQLCVSAIEN